MLREIQSKTLEGNLIAALPVPILWHYLQSRLVALFAVRVQIQLRIVRRGGVDAVWVTFVWQPEEATGEMPSRIGSCTAHFVVVPRDIASTAGALAPCISCRRLPVAASAKPPQYLVEHGQHGW